MHGEDLQGRTFGWWLVLRRWDFECYADGNVRWLVQCRCGKTDVKRSFRVKTAKEGCAACRARDGRRRPSTGRKPRASTRTKVRARMTYEQREEAVRLYAAGRSYTKISAELGVGYQAVWKLINGYTKCDPSRHIIGDTSWQTYDVCTGKP